MLDERFSDKHGRGRKRINSLSRKLLDFSRGAHVEAFDGDGYIISDDEFMKALSFFPTMHERLEHALHRLANDILSNDLCGDIDGERVKVFELLEYIKTDDGYDVRYDLPYREMFKNSFSCAMPQGFDEYINLLDRAVMRDKDNSVVIPKADIDAIGVDPYSMRDVYGFIGHKKVPLAREVVKGMNEGGIYYRIYPEYYLKLREYYGEK